MSAVPSAGQRRTVLVTGAGGGVGRSVAAAFAKEKARVVLVGRSKATLEETARIVGDAGGFATSLPLDITDASAWATGLSAVEEIDVAVNVAGVIETALLGDMEDVSFSRVFDTNVRGLWLSMRSEIQQMRRSGGGVIVNVGSNVGPRVTRPTMGAYAASKAAVSALTRTAAIEELHNSIRVNCICPGPIDTPLSLRAGETPAERDERMQVSNPSGRVATPKEIAEAAVWLASPGASYIVGQEIVIDGGASV